MADFAEFYVIWQQRKAEVALWLMPFLGTLVIGDACPQQTPAPLKAFTRTTMNA
jgi:hypothetical protein